MVPASSWGPLCVFFSTIYPLDTHVHSVSILIQDALRYGGPVGAFLGYSIVGTVVYCLCVSVGEMIAFLQVFRSPMPCLWLTFNKAERRWGSGSGRLVRRSCTGIFSGMGGLGEFFLFGYRYPRLTYSQYNWSVTLREYLNLTSTTGQAPISQHGKRGGNGLWR